MSRGMKKYLKAYKNRSNRFRTRNALNQLAADLRKLVLRGRPLRKPTSSITKPKEVIAMIGVLDHDKTMLNVAITMTMSAIAKSSTETLLACTKEG